MAQVPDAERAYETWKLDQVQHPQQAQSPHPAASGSAMGGSRGGDAPCACWIAPDSSYTTIDNINQWNASGFNSDDDGSFGPIILPFNFQLYGTSYTTTYININGIISFNSYFTTYSSAGFPTSNYASIAPFWADVDLRGTGTGDNIVQFKSTPTALYVNWTNVGYFSMMTDKLNSFQVIISDGTDPVIPNGNNVSFCYGSMQWTTGAASGGIDGFGGTPAVVGTNAGASTDYIQLGRFDHAGDDWNGPSGNPDGVGWLTGRHFSFSTASADISPIFMGIDCDTLDIQPGSSYLYPGWSPAGIPSIGASRPIGLEPNPANDKVTVTWPAELRPALIQVTAMDGSVVLSHRLGNGTTRIQLDLVGLAAGVYSVRLTGATGASTARLLHSAEW